MAQAQTSHSVFQKNCRKFLKNRIAVLGAIFVFMITIVCFLLPLIYDLSPTKQRPWLGATPPLTKHFPSFYKINFEVSKKAVLPNQLQHAKQLDYHIQEQQYFDLRVQTRKGKIKSLTLKNGAKRIQKIDLGSFQKVVELTGIDTIGGSKPLAILKVKDPIPDGFMPKKAKSQWIRIYPSEKKFSSLKITLKDSLVQSIHKDDHPIQKYTLEAENIQSALSDGKKMYVTHWLGTDQLGRDLLSRILYGGRISLMIAWVATFVSIFIGVIIGASAGYFGGKVDRFIMSSIDILYAIPFMFLVILLLVNFGRHLFVLFLALGAVQWLTMARIIRAQVLSIKERTFIDAARLSGANNLQIIFKHLIPNTFSIIIVYATLTVPAVILEESFLAFIGLSVQYDGQSLDSWGALVHQGILALGSKGEQNWLLIFPALVMSITLLSLNTFGDGLRDAFDPHHQEG